MTDDDYVALDDAIATLEHWEREIVDQLARKGVSWKAFSDVLDAMREVHSPSEEA
jgi:hypothetical protein